MLDSINKSEISAFMHHAYSFNKIPVIKPWSILLDIRVKFSWKQGTTNKNLETKIDVGIFIINQCIQHCF